MCFLLHRCHPRLNQINVDYDKVLITYRCSDKILGYDELVHEGCVIMMFINQFIVTHRNTALIGDKYISMQVGPQNANLVNRPYDALTQNIFVLFCQLLIFKLNGKGHEPN